MEGAASYDPGLKAPFFEAYFTGSPAAPSVVCYLQLRAAFRGGGNRCCLRDCSLHLQPRFRG